MVRDAICMPSVSAARAQCASQPSARLCIVLHRNVAHVLNGVRRNGVMSFERSDLVDAQLSFFHTSTVWVSLWISLAPLLGPRHRGAGWDELYASPALQYHMD